MWQASPAQIMPSPALIVSLTGNRFPNKLGHNVPKNILRKLSF